MGNSHFAHFVQSQLAHHYRVVHYYDIFTSLPHKLLGYHHVAQELWQQDYAGDQIKVCDPADGEDSSCSDSRPFYKLTPKDHTSYFGRPNTCSGQ